VSLITVVLGINKVSQLVAYSYYPLLWIYGPGAGTALSGLGVGLNHSSLLNITV